MTFAPGGTGADTLEAVVVGVAIGDVGCDGCVGAGKSVEGSGIVGVNVAAAGSEETAGADAQLAIRPANIPKVTSRRVTRLDLLMV